MRKSKSSDIAAKHLIEEALKLHRRPREKIPFSENTASDDFLNNIEEYPHFFVLGCIMDRQIKASRAWIIPYRVSELIGDPKFSGFLSLDRDTTKSIFIQNSLHRMPDLMARCFWKGIQKVHLDYKDNASRIWKQDNPNSAEVIRRFSEFYGVGQKISTMAVNILVRDFKVQLVDNRAIDISVDVHIDRVFKRLGFVDKNASPYDIIQCARGIYPDYPGIFDSVCWEIGEAWCRPGYPLCEQCIANEYCPKINVRMAKHGRKADC